MIDADLASIYGVTTKRLNQQVQRNRERFPQDFAFELTTEEVEILRLQNATSRFSHGGRRYQPYVFTEHGAIMVSAVLKTPVAIQTSVLIARAFVRMRRLISTNKELVDKLLELENKLIAHDYQIEDILKAIRRLMLGPRNRRQKIGYV